jgi:NitT/TauT family transport system substrate-binding protein
MGRLRILFMSLAALAATIAAGAPATAEPFKIRMPWTVPVANWGSMLLEKKDLLRYFGQSYTLETLRFNGTPPMITALANGELEIADLAFASLGLAIQNAGMTDLRVLTDEFQDGVGDYYTDEFMVLKDGPIQKVEDLKGKVVATNAAGSAVDIVSRTMLRKHGLEDRRDYTTIEAPFPTMRAMLAEKKVDLIPGVLPFSLDPELRKIARPLFLQKDAVGPTQMIIFVARQGVLDAHRAAMTDFFEDMLRSVRWYTDPANHKEVVEICARLTKQPPERFDSWVFTKKDYYRDPDMLPNLDALQANIDAQKALGFLTANIDVRKQADLSFIQEAARRLK